MLSKTTLKSWARTQKSQEARYARSRKIERRSRVGRRHLESAADSRSPPRLVRWAGVEGDLRSDRHPQKHCAPLSETPRARALSHPDRGRSILDRSATVSVIGARESGCDAASSRPADPMGVVEVNAGNR